MDEKNFFDNDNQNTNNSNDNNATFATNEEQSNANSQEAKYEYTADVSKTQSQPYTYDNQQNQYPQYNYSNQQPQQQPPQQTQWTFNEYGPMSGGAKPPKKPKKQKNAKGKSGGIKVFAIVMSVLFVVSILTLVGVIALEQGVIDKKPGETTSQSDSKSKIEIENTPDDKTSTTDPTTGRKTTAAIYKEVNPSVVGVITYTRTTGYQVAGQGSGVIISKDGYIITNAHVVQSSDARMPIQKIEIVLNDEKTYIAKLLGADTKSDLAVLKIDAPNLTPAKLGDSTKLEVGETVIVIGNPSGLTFAGSLTQGVISAVNREVSMSDSGETMKFIQTDAAINPGNSGGAMVNQFGQVVGISSAKISATEYEGIGFAIPMNIAKPIIDSIIENGYVKGRVRIGITYTPIQETFSQLNGIPMGLRVIDIDPSFDVAKKGVQRGDIITKIDNKEVYDQETISKALEGKKPNDEILLSIYRVDESGRAKTFDFSIKLGEDTPVAIQ